MFVMADFAGDDHRKNLEGLKNMRFFIGLESELNVLSTSGGESPVQLPIVKGVRLRSTGLGGARLISSIDQQQTPLQSVPGLARAAKVKVVGGRGYSQARCCHITYLSFRSIIPAPLTPLLIQSALQPSLPNSECGSCCQVY